MYRLILDLIIDLFLLGFLVFSFVTALLAKDTAVTAFWLATAAICAIAFHIHGHGQVEKVAKELEKLSRRLKILEEMLKRKEGRK